MRRGRMAGGYTIVEMTVGVFLSLIVVFALGRIIVQSEKSWGWGQDKVRLQQNTTEALEWMARSVRAARSLTIVSGTEFSTKDTTGTVVHNFKKWPLSGPGTPYLLQDGSPLVDKKCISFVVTGDSANVTLKLRLQNTLLPDTFSVAATTRAAVRNRTFEF